MARYVFLVMTSPVEGREEEYNDWYSNHHLDDILKIEGIIAAQRFKLCGAPDLPDGKPYFALYEIEADSPAMAYQAMSAKAQSGAMYVSDALDRNGIYAAFYEPITERKVEKMRSAAE